MRYSLFLDDERYPQDVKWVTLPLASWDIVRNYDQFVDIITKRGLPDKISFDHDLCSEHYTEYFRSIQENRQIDYSKFKERTGFDCAKWIVNYCIDRRLQIPVYYVHSMNEIGKRNIISILESLKK